MVSLWNQKLHHLEELDPEMNGPRHPQLTVPGAIIIQNGPGIFLEPEILKMV